MLSIIISLLIHHRKAKCFETVPWMGYNLQYGLRSWVLVLLTVDGDSVDEPADLRLGVAGHPTGQASRLFRGQDQIPGGTDPERSSYTATQRDNDEKLK